MNSSTKRILLAIFVIGLLIIIRFSGIHTYVSLESIQKHSQIVKSFTDQHFIISSLLFIGLVAGCVTLTIPITPLLTIASGYFFNMILGALFSVIGSTLGATLSFLIVRYVARDAIQQQYGEKIKVFNEEFKKRGASYLLFLQLLPVTPYMIIIIISSLSTVSFLTFVWTTFLGILPGSFIYAYAGKQLLSLKSIRHIFSWQIILALSLLALLSLIPVIFRWLKKNKKI